MHRKKNPDEIQRFFSAVISSSLSFPYSVLPHPLLGVVVYHINICTLLMTINLIPKNQQRFISLSPCIDIFFTDVSTLLCVCARTVCDSVYFYVC